MILNCEGKKLIMDGRTRIPVREAICWDISWAWYYIATVNVMDIHIWKSYNGMLLVRVDIFDKPISSIKFDIDHDYRLSFMVVMKNIITERFDKLNVLNYLLPAGSLVMSYNFETILNFFDSGCYI